MKGMSGLKILAIDTSAAAASCAVCEDGVVLGESYVSRKLTHSQTILPMVEDLLKNCRLTVSEMDGFAVAAGPGSFTGLRIGISAVKALAFAEGKPAAGVSTLQALAYNLMGVSGIVCAVMDARCGQVYSGVFQGKDCGMVRLLDDDAQMVEQLFEKLESLCAEKKQTVWLVGDGAALCMRRYEALAPAFEARMAPPARLLAHASSVALAALENLALFAPAVELNPIYLRLPQAERELRARQEKEKAALERK